MEELPLEQNIFPSDISENNLNYNDLDLLNNQELDYDVGSPSVEQEMEKSKDKTIKQLKRKIKAYKKKHRRPKFKII